MQGSCSFPGASGPIRTDVSIKDRVYKTRAIGQTMRQKQNEILKKGTRHARSQSHVIVCNVGKWWRMRDARSRPIECKSIALLTELIPHWKRCSCSWLLRTKNINKIRSQLISQLLRYDSQRLFSHYWSRTNIHPELSFCCAYLKNQIILLSKNIYIIPY